MSSKKDSLNDKIAEIVVKKVIDLNTRYKKYIDLILINIKEQFKSKYSDVEIEIMIAPIKRFERTIDKFLE